MKNIGFFMVVEARFFYWRFLFFQVGKYSFD
jgi:hypothetical protein